MPGNEHEAIVELVRMNPQFAVDLLADVAQVRLPVFTSVAEGSPDLSQTAPIELRSDAVVTLHGVDDTPVMGIIVEIQLRVDQRKLHSWPAYLHTLRTRLNCPVAILVISLHEKVARWARAPIILGPGSIITPIAIGPGSMPAVTDPAHAQAHPGMALLSAMAHPENHQILDALLTTITPNTEHGLRYADLVRTVLPEVARRYLEDQMTTSTWQYQSDFARKYYGAGKAEGLAEGEAKGLAEGEAKGLVRGEAKGLAEGEAKGLLAVLAARAIPVPDDTRARIAECADTEQLNQWITRAATATTLADVFD